MEDHPLWEEVKTSTGNVSFRLKDDRDLVCQREAVRNMAPRPENEGAVLGVCLVSGRKAPIAELHPPVKGVWGGQASGGRIVSFNLAAFRSQEKTQNLNAPVGEEAAFAYTTGPEPSFGQGLPQPDPGGRRLHRVLGRPGKAPWRRLFSRWWSPRKMRRTRPR